MRLRFRIFDKVTNKMICTGIGLFGEYMMFGMVENYLLEHKDGDKSVLERFGDIVEMQYVGLKDTSSEKREVYEGDVVGFKNDKKNKKWADVQVVKIEDGRLLPFYGEDFDSQDEGSWGHLQEFAHYEVLGNIFENPELVEQYKLTA